MNKFKIDIKDLVSDNNYTADEIVTPKIKGCTITVGGNNADIPGLDNAAIQMAVDALPAEGGTVKMHPEVFQMMAPVRVPSNVKLIGSGSDTILKRIDGFCTKIIVDADYGELKLTVENVSGFEVGMSIQVSSDQCRECWDISTGVITDIEENIIHIDTHLIRDYDCNNNGIVTNAGSCITVTKSQNVYLSNFTIDGNKEKNFPMDGCNGGGIAIKKSKHVLVENIHIKDFNGEGITWQICENITVSNNEISGCTNIGFHPGTGAPNSIIMDNNVHHNKIGLFICWRVQHSVIKNNQFHHNREVGISIGHKDSDNLFEQNHIYENGENGIFFRIEDEKNAPHRCAFIKNIIENNGTKKNGYGILFDGKALDVAIIGNIIRNTGKGRQQAAIFIKKSTPPVMLENNTMSGHPAGDVIREK